MKFFKSIAVIITMLITTTAQYLLHAGLSPLAFKNVGKCFNPGYEFYNPIFGSVALTSGLIENLRFYNVDASIDGADNRNYIKDKAPVGDHVMEIVRILFPSPAGQLTTETIAADNFGRYCEPKHIAALLNFAHAIRTFLKTDKTTQGVKNILNKTKQQDVINKAFPDDPFKQTEGSKNALLKAITEAIDNEVRPKKNSINPQFYPSYIVEQILNAFLCHKFADQQNIKDLLQGIDDIIVDKSKIAAIDGLLTKENVAPALEKLNTNPDKIDLDDIWIICNRDIFTRILPYKHGKTPISNEANTLMYQRSSNKLSDKTFADCVEVALRHIINFMLYDPINHRFNAPTLDNPYIRNLYDFYTIQSPDKADAGGSFIRSTWNKVVADLGNGIVYLKKFNDIKNNELDSGMLNLMRVFKTIFSLELSDEPIYETEKENDFKANAEKLVIDGLSKLFGVLNANHTCVITCSNVSVDPILKDLIGDINIEVTNNSGEKLFSFSIRVQSQHVDIQNLAITKKDSVALTQNNIKMLHDKVAATNYKKTIFPSLLLLDDELESPETLTPLFLMFRETINDSTSMITALKNIQHLLTKPSFSKPTISRDHAARILKNILHNFLWDDREAIRTAMETIMELKELAEAHANQLAPVLRNGVKSLALKNNDDVKFINFFSNIENLYSAKQCEIEILNLSLFPKLKKLDLDSARELSLIDFPAIMENIEYINLNNSTITKLELPPCPKLKNLYAAYADLQTIVFPADMESLEELNLEHSDIENLKLPSSPKLETLGLLGTWLLKTITFPTAMESLKVIDLRLARRIVNLELPSLPKLQRLELAVTKALTSIIILGPIPNLTTIDISNSPLKKITGIHFCPMLDTSKIPPEIIVDQSSSPLKEKLEKLRDALQRLKTKLQELATNLATLKKKLS